MSFVSRSLMALLLLFGSLSISATSLTVVNSDDSGPGSFRDQVLNASAGDTILFDQLTNGNDIILSSGIVIDKNLIIIGNGIQNTILDGNNSVRQLKIESGTTVTITNLSLENGNNLISTGVDAFGGAILNLGTLFISNSRINNNKARIGSGISSYLDGQIHVANCIISGNQSTNFGGALHMIGNIGSGSVKNSIISGNHSRSGGGIYNHTSNLVLSNNTITGNFATLNGGGIWYFGSTIQLTNNIVAINGATSGGPDIWKQSTAAVLSDQGYNLIGNNSSSGSNWNGTGNLTGVNPLFLENAAAAPTDSGDFTLNSNSPAFNAGTPDPTSLNLGDFDVFGNKRVAGRIDIGAVEVNPAEGLHFDGIDDYVLIDLAPNFFFEPNYTIETWIKFDGDPKNQNIFVLSDDNGPEDFYTHQIRVNKDGFFEHSTFEQDFVKHRVHPIKAEADTWYHVGIDVQSQSNIMGMIVNGVPLQFEPLFNFTNTSGGNKFYVGHPACGHDSFKGVMDELRVWNIATSSANIEELNGNEPGLLYNYKFNQGSGGGNNIAVDTIPNAVLSTDLPNAQLFNFDLEGDVSNWVDCNQYSSTLALLSQPTNQEVEHGRSATFSVGPPSGVESTIQWYKDSEPIPGANASTLDFANTTFANEGTYYAVISFPSSCPVKSESANLVVKGSGKVLNFDGENDYLDIESLNDGRYTIEMWVKFEGNPANQNLITGTDDSGPNIRQTNQIYTDENGAFAFHTLLKDNTTEITDVSNVIAQPDTWYHVALAGLDPTGYDLYINGNNVLTSTQAGAYMGPRHIVGGASSTGTLANNISLNPFKGEMDELRIWFIKRTQAEIQANYNAEVAENSPSLGHYYKFDRGVANVDNSNPMVDFIPNISSNSYNFKRRISMHNFDFQGPVSNWSDCSPLDIPEVELIASTGAILKGAEYQLAAKPINTFSLYDYQWLKDDVAIPGATDSVLFFENFDETDLGFYKVQVTNSCNPSSSVNSGSVTLSLACYTENVETTIPYTQSLYTGCTDPVACPLFGSLISTQISKGYCDTDQEYPGGQLVYLLPLTNPAVVQLSLSNLNADVDMFLMSDDCNLDNCLGSSTNNLLLDENIEANLDSGNYYIIIDSKDLVGASNFELNIELFDDKCAFSEPITCGEEIIANTGSGSDLIASFCNENTDYSGLEKVYELTLTEAKTITVNLSDLNEDLDVFLLNGNCKEDSCIASAIKPGTTEEFIISSLGAGNYFIVVDGKNGVQGDFKLKLECLDNFSATKLDNDAYVDLNWNIDKATCVPQDTGILIKLIDQTNTTLFEQEFTTAALTPDVIAGTFRHYVGPDINRNYVIRVFNRLSNKKICESFDNGSTTSFAVPDILEISDSEYPDSIRIVWRNYSKLADHYRVIKEGQQIANLTEGYTEDSLLVSFVDVYDPLNPNYLKNGSQYIYCIEAFSTVFNQTYNQQCLPGKTYDIGFQASDNNPINQVDLSWNTLKDFGSTIKIRRDGVSIGSISAFNNSFVDKSPIFGKTSSYSIALVKDGEELIEQFDNGSVPANGSIGGTVTTENDNYPVQNITIELYKDSTIAGAQVAVLIDSTITDFNGSYQFNDLFYGLSETFTVKAIEVGVTFTEAEKIVELNGGNNSLDEVNFEETSDLLVQLNPTLIDTFYSEIFEQEDRVLLHWDYDYNSDDTLFFNLFRGGDLIGQFNDASGKIENYNDLDGVPGLSYLYSIEVFKRTNTGFENQNLSLTINYPNIVSPVNVVASNNADPSINIGSNTHPSSNIEGFRFYRDGDFIGETTFPNNTWKDSLALPGSVVSYQMTAFRVVNDLVYESALAPNPPTNTSIPSLIAPTNLTVQMPLESDKIVLEWEVPSVLDIDYGYDGFVILRKKSSGGEFEELNKIKKEFAPANSTQIYTDLTGIPGEPYDYQVATYLDLMDSLHLEGSQISAIFPAVTPPSILTTSTAPGKVNLSWPIPNSDNLDGWILRRKDNTNNGAFDTLATLEQFELEHNDYVNNPIYDAFLDSYTSIEYLYQLFSYRIVDGEIYPSLSAQILLLPQDDLSLDEPSVTNPIASNDIVNHIKVCWDWEAAKQSEFIIYREDIAIDTLPPSARTFYDYDAPSSAIVEYSISSLNNGNESAKVLTSGRLLGRARIEGKIVNFNSNVGVPNIKVVAIDQNPSNALQYESHSDSTGSFFIGNIPSIENLVFDLDISGINVDFDQGLIISQSTNAVVSFNDSTNVYTLTIYDYSTTSNSEDLAIQAFEAMAKPVEMGIALTWSPTNANYSGFEVYRMNTQIADVKAGQEFAYFDNEGFPGFTYTYNLIAYLDTPEGRVFSETASASAEFPTILPVENLSLTSFTEKNLMRLSWSHPLDNVDGYRVRRNGIFKAFIPAGEVMMWYDSTGIPGFEYLYEVTAFKNPLASDPIEISGHFKGVGEVLSIDASVPEQVLCDGQSTSLNHVLLEWTYMDNGADGFEIYRDGALIAEVKQNELYYVETPNVSGTINFENGNGFYADYQGQPGTMHEYQVLPFVIREENRYTSGIEELIPNVSIGYPLITGVANFSAVTNSITGNADLSFEYQKDIVRGFEILRNGSILDTVLAAHDSDFTYFDIAGIPGASYEYAIRPFVKRNGTSFYGAAHCAQTLDYSNVPVPQNPIATQGTFPTHIEFTWNFELESFVDSFQVENIDLGITTSYAMGVRKHTEIVELDEFEAYQYRVRALRNVQGTIIYSEWTEVVSGFAKSQIDGDEIIDALNDCDSHRLGSAVAIDGEWAAASAIYGEAKVNIYRRIDGAWLLFEEIYNPYTLNTDGEYGFSLALEGESLIVGAPKMNKVFSYHFDGQSWGLPNEIPTVGITSGRFGHSVEMVEDRLIIGRPTNNSGQVYYYERNGLNWEAVQTLSNPGGSLFGASIAMDGNNLSISKKDGSNSDYAPLHVYNYKFNNNTWVYHYDFDSDTDIEPNQLFPDNMDLAGDRLAVAGANLQEGYVIIFKRNGNGVYIEEAVISHPDLLDGDVFGFSLAISEIPSPADPAFYVLIGARFRTDQNVQVSGAAYLYSNISDTWQLNQQLDPIEINEYDEYGYSVALSQDALMVGVPLRTAYDRGAVEIRNLISAPSYVSATDGISLNNDLSKTTVSWEYQGDANLVSGFNIYRDDEFLVFRNIATTTTLSNNLIAGEWDDNSGNPGQKYVYTVKASNEEIPFESVGTSDQGFNRANGIIRGTVRTEIGLVAVPGVEITATAVVADEVYTYKTSTLPNGEYTFNELFYDSDPAIASEYTLSAAYLDHIIVPQNTDQATLNSLNDPVQSIVNFIDQTAYVIKGNVSQPNVDCPLEGVEVDQVINGTIQVGLGTTTDAEGNYALIINPNQSGLNQLKVRINNTLSDEAEKTQYDFVPDGDTIYNSFSNFPVVTELNFVDQLTYAVPLKVKNTCLDPISTGRWLIRVRTLDGCFDEEFTTNTSGDLVANLLPLNYEMKVIGVDDLNGPNQLAVDYFANFPVKLNLLDLHKDSLESLTSAEIEEKAARNFTYHKAPTIEITGFSDFFCNQPSAVIKQGEEYTINVNISETHNGFSCPVQEGKVTITNPAAADGEPIDIFYDDVAEVFPAYTFIAGGPNPNTPHFYALTVDYKTVDGEFLGRNTQAVFVEGSIGVPGTDILVDASSGNDAIPYPLMVLRDPPGDGSSSYIEANQTFNFTTTMSMEETNGVALAADFSKEIFGVGVKLSASLSANSSVQRQLVINNSVTSSQRVSTSSDDGNIGRDADVIVGAGIVMQYGIVNEYSVGNCDTIKKVTKYGISPNAANTTWSYTVKQIEDVIQGYINDSIRVRTGNLIIERAGRELSAEEASIFISSNLDNWRAVIRYHDVETVPYYMLCTIDPPSLSNDQRLALDIWQAQLRPFFGEMVNNEFILFDEIIWDQQLIDFYNAAGLAIRRIISGDNYQPFAFPYIGDPLGIDLTIPLVNFTLVDFGSILNLPDVQSYQQNFGEQVKNITTGGNVMISESIENLQSSTTSISNSVFLGKEYDVTATINRGNTVFLGAFAGLGGGVLGGVIEETVNFELNIGRKVTVESKRSNQQEIQTQEAVEVGFTLFDDDATDAFSVAVIQGVDQFHTPYFEQFGGHTSCPPEEGTVWVDNPLIAVIDPNGNGTSDSGELFNVPANDAAIFGLVIDNQTPLASKPDRENTVFLVNTSNDNGARVLLNGTDLSIADLTINMPAFQADTINLTIERGPVFYDYEDITIGIKPTCDASAPIRYVTLSAFFQTPCSPVTIVTPDPAWVINGVDNFLQIGIQDYDPDNMNLLEAILEYRRIGPGEDWTPVPILELGLSSIVDTSTLIAWNKTISEGQIPIYYFDWTLPTELSAYPDGDYEIRVRMDCGSDANISNAISGKIAREGVYLFGNPEPADQVWTSGDEISFTFNKDLDCSLIDSEFIDDNIYILDENTGDTLNFTLTCYNNKIIFQLDQPMSTYDDHILTVVVNEIPATTGNITGTEMWSFRVVTQTIYWSESDTFKVRLYKNEVATVSFGLNNSTSVTEEVGLSSGGASWLTILDPTSSTFPVGPFGDFVDIQFTANQPEGVYNETIEVTGLAGNPPTLHVQLEVLNEAPNWEIDPSGFDKSMNLVSNWRFVSDTINSVDTTDLISVWYGDEIRGLARIEKSGSAFFASHIEVYGRASDPATFPLSFRIWDAKEGIEYNGNPTSEILFIENGNIGTTSNPEILLVDEIADQVQYIPLRQFWTGFSLNTASNNMSLNTILNSLSSVTEGDIIKTSDAFAIYTDQDGWVNQGENDLNALNNATGYMIHLQNGPDTLRVLGALASNDNVLLNYGWNWIGYPFRDAMAIDPTFKQFNATSNDLLKIDSPLPGSFPTFAQYDFSMDQWNGIQNMIPNNLYKIYVDNLEGGELAWTPNLASNKPTAIQNNIADIGDESTWDMNIYHSDKVMPVVAEIYLDSILDVNVNDRIAFFRNDTLVGTADLRNFENGLTGISLIVEGDLNDIQIYLFVGNSGRIYKSTQDISFLETGYGNFRDPHKIYFKACALNLTLTVDDSPLSGIYEAGGTITISGNVNILAGTQVELRAPIVRIIDRVETFPSSQIIIKPNGCQ